MRERTATALEMRRQFGDLLDDVANGKIHLTITRANQPLATLISYHEHERYCSKEERGRRIFQAMRRIEKWKKRNAKLLKGLSKIDAAQAIRKIRDAR